MNRSKLMKRTTSLLVAGIMLSFSTTPLVLAEAQMQMNPTQMQMMGSQTSPGLTQGQSYIVPAGTSLNIHTMGAAPLNVGESFTGQLTAPVVVNGVTVLPAGSQIRGTVVGINPDQNTMDIQFREVSTTTGEVIPIRSRATVTRLQAGVQQRAAYTGPATFYPRVTFGPEPVSDAAKITAGTLGGALFGAATGTLTGLTIAGVSDIGINEGTGAVRGLAWGSAYGAGLGLISGLIAAAADRNRVVTTTAGVPATRYRPATNITTGALEEIPVAYTAAQPVGASPDFVIILEQPATVVMP